MGLRDSLKFAVWLAIIVGAFLAGAATGATLAYKMGYDDAWERQAAHYRDFVPKGEPIDWSKVDRSKLKGPLQPMP